VLIEGDKFFEAENSGRKSTGLSTNIQGNHIGRAAFYLCTSHFMASDPREAANLHRPIENIHILFWLIKDACWAMEWKAGGFTMIFPTVGVALWLLFRNRRDLTEFYHNLAVVFWILANSVWMCGEFMGWETRPAAAVLFIGGLLFLAVYYLIIRPRRKKVP
jgi:hypothetical protein